ncbi:cupredoxin domain-containing protein [Hydrogenovibrio thermophilus]|uniref:Cupredoxin domain-containing protein n=2 Tax=Hydrogenovibrio TaxID=28884 RepID=A0A410H5N8_9GAMM|nr:cupredoxin domain-containing protein [Hydrogenovibrio thermophilus]QAB16243.1 cupredoxin domain-containing protein [Hydrogenovibrio thermophilus]RUM93074.1 MAG: cupredoxin domain-containing protein [Thiomicrospira sp.]
MKPLVLLQIILGSFFYSTLATATMPKYEITIKDHRFLPAEITIEAGKKVLLIVHNQDATAEEFESYSLNREKLIRGQTKAKIFIGPLKPGKYPFFGEFFHKTAQGTIVVK